MGKSTGRSSPLGPYHHIGVVGAGAWGTALALVAARAGSQVTLWAREADVVADIARTGENRRFLSGYRLDGAITATADLAALGSAEAIFLVVPAQHTAQIVAALASCIQPVTPLLLCAKGIERTTNRLMSEVVGTLMPACPLAVLSGPSFAVEVAARQPSAVIIAGLDEAVTRRFAATLADGRFRPYTGVDPCGAQIGGALKNVLAIGGGIVAGRDLGENARAAFITRGLAEMIRFGEAQGALRRTLTGLAGLGDLCLTCSSEKSRNMARGAALGRGTDVARFLVGKSILAEGAWTAAAVADMAEKAAISMPICGAVDAILNHGADIDQAIEVLLARPLTNE